MVAGPDANAEHGLEAHSEAGAEAGSSTSEAPHHPHSTSDHQLSAPLEETGANGPRVPEERHRQSSAARFSRYLHFAQSRRRRDRSNGGEPDPTPPPSNPTA